MYLLAICISVFGKMSVWIFCPFFDCTICLFIKQLYIFFIYSGYIFLIYIWLANIFSQYVSCLFTLLMWYLKYKSLILMKSHLFFFSFDTCGFGVIFKKSLPNPRSWRLTPVFSSKSFIVLPLTFSSRIHFELIFVYSIRKGSKFSLFHMHVQLS